MLIEVVREVWNVLYLFVGEMHKVFVNHCQATKTHTLLSM